VISVEEARKAVLEHAATNPSVPASLAEALGLVLAEDVASDIDSPPFDKAMVDGYAVRASDLSGGSAELVVIEEVTAGQMATRSGGAGQCWRIMTGAPLPPGTDAVVMHELTTLVEAPASNAASARERVRIRDDRFRVGQNILRQAANLRRGQTVLVSGRVLRPLEIGLLAEVGRARVAVIEPARVAILSTGSELVPPDQVPVAGQIRNSNGPMLNAWVRRLGARSVDLGIAEDAPDVLRAKLAEGLRHDVLLISGGVSAGKLDLVPGLLHELGVVEVFHKIRLKPGKPLWFGIASGHRAGATPTLVFGLPGNPVSSLVCAALFVRPALERLAGREVGPLVPGRAELTAEFAHRGDRPTFLPSALDSRDKAHPRVQPIAWTGSADLRSLTDANALAVFAAGERTYRSGEIVDVVDLDA
jgi:molybdopterin molybdotransferase